jgi:hypothetical protein
MIKMTVSTATVDTFTQSNCVTVRHGRESREELVIVSKLYQKFLIAFAIILFVMTASSGVSAKSWRGITPLRSTAEDVRKLFPACEEKPTGCSLTFDDQEVVIIYSGGGTGPGECRGVPKGTVLAVIVRFRDSKKLQEFKLNRERVTTFDSSEPPRRIYKAYYYAREGFIINTYKGNAFQLAYIAAQRDIPLCPEYYDEPKDFVVIGTGHERLN